MRAPTDRELWMLTVPDLVHLITRSVEVLRLRLVTGHPEVLRVIAEVIECLEEIDRQKTPGTPGIEDPTARPGG